MGSQEHQAYLSIGSNLGNKKENLEAAVRLLEEEETIRVDAVSSFYRTQPQNYLDQDWFVNAAVKISTSLEPESLLAVLKQMERQMDADGKPFRFGPRLIDLDIIYFENWVVNSETLQIPHRRMHERCFVLVPLSDIGNEVVHPVLKQRPAELLKKIETQDSQKVILLTEEANGEIFY